MTFNITSKEVLAKLMASENITVVHKNAETASFDVKNRVLTLPQWRDMGNETYDHLVGHEVGHSLYTPADEWLTACEGKSEGYRSFVNVVEDARIEKLIQRRYPGLRRSFIKSYRKMLTDGFFGKDEAEINNFKLIDRLNVYFKCGASLGVEFSAEEREWVNKIDNAETFQDVLDIVNSLYDSASKEYEEEQIQALSMFNEDDEDEYEEEDGDESEVSISENDDEGDEDSREINTDEDSDDTSAGQVNDELAIDGPIAETYRALEKNIHNNFVDNDIEVYNFFLKDTEVDTLIQDYKEIIENHSSNDYASLRFAAERIYKKFVSESKNSINYMVKEFEMRKSASAYSRAKIAKTGVIDSVKMNNYKFSDDIFRKMTVLPEGKNHGMIMYIDWSGSMADDLENTIVQLLNMVLFCKQVNIPFEVYAFTDRRSRQNSMERNMVKDEFMYTENFKLMRLFDNKMNRKQLGEIAGILLATAKYFKGESRYEYSVNYDMWLGGTPLPETIMAAFKIYENFKKTNRCDIVNTIFLTDGDGNDITACMEVNDDVLRERSIRDYFDYWARRVTKIVNFVDPVTKKSYRVSRYDDISPTLLKMYRDRTGETVIGYRLVSATKAAFIHDVMGSVTLGYSECFDLWEKAKKQRFVTVPSKAYDDYFIILGGKNLETSNGEIQVSEDASKAKIRTAFRKANTGKRESRVLLSKFIEKIA